MGILSKSEKRHIELSKEERAKKCSEEITEILKKYNCKIEVMIRAND